MLTMSVKFDLPDEFINLYRSIEPDWGYGELGKFTYYRTYSRTKEDGTQENWVDTCRRVVEGSYSLQKEHCLNEGREWDEAKAKVSAEEMFDRMFHMKFLPPGRGLWMMGTDYVMKRRDSAALQNCFVGSTEIITEDGIMSLSEIAGEWARVLTSKGFVDAKVESFGVQPTQRVTFAPAQVTESMKRKLRSNLRKTVDVTPDHRWILADGSETTQLSVGDFVPSMGFDNHYVPDYNEGLKHGLIFGDGSMASHTYTNGDMLFFMRMCDEKTRTLIDLFDNVRYQPADNGDPTVSIRTTTNMKELPVGKTPSYIKGFIEGWMIADAHLDPSGSYCLDTQKKNAAQWIVDNAPYAGYVVSGWNVEYSDTNFGPRKSPLNRMTLKSFSDGFWKVESIDELTDQEVFCPVVPDVNEFTLAGGIYTGNCGFVSSKGLHRGDTRCFTWLMDMSMLGVGVGFDTRGAGTPIYQPKKSYTHTFVIPDTREGWVKSVGLLIDSYIKPHQVTVEFSYDLIRGKGEPIKGFGGVASGPEPLEKLHDRIRGFLKGTTKLTSRVITDIQNAIGACVVAGNVRRSAELALGSFDDAEFLDLKNYEVNPERSDFGWASNNSIVVRADDDVDYSKVAERIASNGEPGIFYIDNARNYGRMNGVQDTRDSRIEGVNPCAEQMLEDGELCNLVEVFPTRCDGIVDFLRTIKFAYLYAKSVTLLQTHDEKTNEIMRRNRRIGTSVSGVVEFLHTKGNKDVLEQWLEAGYGYIDNLDNKYSDWLGIERSIRKTTVKPSGTVSILAGVTPGVHYPVADTHIRRVRIFEDHALVKIAMAAGYHVEPDKYSDNTMVIEFPVRGKGIPDELTSSIFDKADVAAFMAKHWADNAVSVTVKFKSDEASMIETVLRQYANKWKTVSFLEANSSAYEQLPYERISEEAYIGMSTGIEPMDFSSFHGDGENELFCTTDVCEINIG